MNRISFLVIVFLFPLLGIAQGTSIMYNEKGEFRPNPSLKITIDQYQVWKKTELKIFTDCGHGNLAANMKREIANKKFNKRNIISFDCDSTGISNIMYVKKYKRTWDGDAESEDLDHVKNQSEAIFEDLKEANKKYFKDKMKIYGTYYINL